MLTYYEWLRIMSNIVNQSPHGNEYMPTNCDMCAPSKGNIFDGTANNFYSDILNPSNLLSLETGLSSKKYPKREYIRCILNRIRHSQLSKEE